MARDTTERLDGNSDLESRGSSFFCTPARANTTLTSIYKCGFMLVLKVVVFLHDPSYCCCTLLKYPTYSFVSFSRVVFLLHGRVDRCSIVVVSLNPAHSFVICSEWSFREGCPRELAHSPSCSQRVLDLGRVSLMTTRPLEYCSNLI